MGYGTWIMPFGAADSAALSDAISGLVLILGIAMAVGLAVLAMGAASIVLSALLPGVVRRTAVVQAAQPFRTMLLGAINIAGLLVLTAILGAHPLGGLLGLLLLVVLAFSGLLGLVGLGWNVAAFFSPPEGPPGRRQLGAGGGLLVLAWFFPILGQAFAIFCLCAAVGGVVLGARQRY